jgi:UDP-N-acetylmuramate--alanine ligase
MIALQDIKRIYFIGAGGIGMSALVRFFNANGAVVCGYDKTATNLSKALETEGVQIHYSDDITLLDKDTNVVVYTPAIPADLAELNWYRNNGYAVMKRSDMLQIISKAMNALCVAGTHGKTTTSTILAHILRHTGVGCNAFLGGISVNYNTNYWGSANQTAVIEADEYDRSFLKLHPNMTIVTSMDADHLDIYGTEKEMLDTYVQFINSTSEALVYRHGLARRKEFAVPAMYSYSLQNDASDFYASDIQMHHGTYSFNFCFKGEVLCTMKLNVGGMHNIENTIGACAIAYLQKIDIQKIADSVADYKGVKRRFEYIINDGKQVFIDDYAHHPEELTALIKSAKALFPNRKCTVAFQPHLFSRTQDFVNGFAQSLSLADEVILLDIYPARELPMAGVTSQIILDKMTIENKHILSKEGLLEFTQASTLPLFITAGAGDIDTLIHTIKNNLLKNNQA